MLSFINVIRPPELLELVDDVIPILHGERTFAHHHNGHGDAVVGAIDIRVPEAVSEIEVMTTNAHHTIITDLCRTLHVQDTGLSLIAFYQLGKNPLAIALASQFLTDSEIPIPVEGLAWIDDGEANELFTIIVGSEVQ